jgi:hypothetical protein
MYYLSIPSTLSRWRVYVHRYECEEEEEEEEEERVGHEF